MKTFNILFAGVLLFGISGVQGFSFLKFFFESAGLEDTFVETFFCFLNERGGLKWIEALDLTELCDKNTQTTTTAAPFTFPDFFATTTTEAYDPNKVYALNTAGCTNKLRLNSTSGSYLGKTICAVDKAQDYSSANFTCLKLGMKLLILDTQTLWDSFVTAMGPFHGNYLSIYIRYWVNGKKDASNNWIAYNPSPIPVYTGGSWVFGDKTSGSCLTGYKLTPLNSMEFSGTSCSDSFYVFCEYP